VFGEERVSKVSIETGAVWNGQSFEGDTEGIGEERSGRNLFSFQDRMEGKREIGCRDKFDSGE
jgi:hypothetical protein